MIVVRIVMCMSCVYADIRLTVFVLYVYALMSFSSPWNLLPHKSVLSVGDLRVLFTYALLSKVERDEEKLKRT